MKWKVVVPWGKRKKTKENNKTEATLKQNPKNSLSVSAYPWWLWWFLEALSGTEGFLVLYGKLEMEQVSEITGKMMAVELDGILSLQQLGMLAAQASWLY